MPVFPLRAGFAMVRALVHEVPMRRSLFVAVLCAAGCSAAPPVGEMTDPIIGGVADPNDPGVVLVLAQMGRSAAICTGEVVSPHVVMTAAHCVDPAVLGAGYTYQVFTGSDLNSPSQGQNAFYYKQVKETHFDPQFNPNNLQGGHDIAVVITRTALAQTPLPLNRTPLDQSQIGSPLRIVGFGVNNGADTMGATAGTKRQTNTTLNDFDPLLIALGDARHDTCEGDSGGPAFLVVNGVEVVAGITSFGDQGCVQGGWSTRVDVFGPAFVDPWIQMFDPPAALPDLATTAPDMATTTAGPGGPAPGELGAACSVHPDCHSGVCISQDDGNNYCTQPCDLAGPNFCPTGYACTAFGVNGSDGVFCVRAAIGAGAHSTHGCSLAGRAPASGACWPLLAAACGWPLVRRSRRRRPG